MTVLSVKCCFFRFPPQTGIKTEPLLSDSHFFPRRKATATVPQLLPLHSITRLWGSLYWSLSARFYTFGSSGFFYSVIGSDGGTEIYLSDSALIKDPKDKLPLCGGLSFSSKRLCVWIRCSFTTTLYLSTFLLLCYFILLHQYFHPPPHSSDD